MKITCSFCKTEFGVRRYGARCPLCGRVANVGGKKSSKTTKLFIVVALFLLTGIFATISLQIFNHNQKAALLTVTIANVSRTKAGYVVRGNIRNFSDKTYSVPDMVFILKTENGIELRRVSSLPPAGLIEPLSDMEFIRTIAPMLEGAQRISVQFEE